MLPDAIGLNLFLGWSLSFSISIKSLKIYTELAQREKARNTGKAIRRLSVRNSVPPKKGAAKSSKFFIQW
jgi:hypothetical protein